MGLGEGGIDPGSYCREVEAFLCRKNDGHLIRIAGPSFELVSGWAAQGIPLRVVFEGIDRFFERYYRKGPRRRPVHIAFCEGDVLEAFESWRRATGIGLSGAQDEGAAAGRVAQRARKGPGLASHLERTIAALTARRAGAPPNLDAALARAVRELDLIRAGHPSPRGDARTRILERLRALDEQVLAEARAELPAEELAALIREAEASLAPFRERMPAEAWAGARAAAIDRAVRSSLKLPSIVFE